VGHRDPFDRMLVAQADLEVCHRRYRHRLPETYHLGVFGDAAPPRLTRAARMVPTRPPCANVCGSRFSPQESPTALTSGDRRGHARRLTDRHRSPSTPSCAPAGRLRRGGRMKIEDEARVTSGIRWGETLGSPIASS
jgi:hypothetical protein